MFQNLLEALLLGLKQIHALQVLPAPVCFPHPPVAEPPNVPLQEFWTSCLVLEASPVLHDNPVRPFLSGEVRGSLEKIDLAQKIVTNYTFYFSLYFPQLLCCSFSSPGELEQATD